MSAVPLESPDQSSGTTSPLQSNDNDNNHSRITSDDPSLSEKSPTGREEHALESHEVIELQTFIEKKAWIEEKIKFLEKMPIVEVFTGLDAVKSSAEEVPGLLTRLTLQQWIKEHDAIEKDTESLDSGELKKLRQFTRAATQRILSPGDTDLIELTLTTIYDLDKLLHLLRDRSESLDLLSVRLTWEEHRIASWRERRQIIDDLQSFLETRARWSPTVYETVDVGEEGRRGSVGSVKSVSSDVSLAAPGFSRSSRFKMAESLSRDAAQFASRITTLRHGHIAAAGKALDKLIDSSRKPVPEELLDEQDKLEEMGIADMETVGKFVMHVVMQWRKADELYIETLKDQTSARVLIEDLNNITSKHPTAKQCASLTSRADALLKRMVLRGNPSKASNLFPSPCHHLFLNQETANTTIIRDLSSEVSSASDLAQSANVLAKQYRVRFESVARAEAQIQAMEDCLTQLGSITQRLCFGIPSNEGDGSPPNLMTEDCLDPTRHSVFFALLPSLLAEHDTVGHTADELLRQTPPTLLHLDFPGVDPEFKSRANAAVQQIVDARNNAREARDIVEGSATRLRDARKIWRSMNNILQDLDGLHRNIGDAMESHRWIRDSSDTTSPPTPESPPTIPLPSVTLQADISSHIEGISAQLEDDVRLPLNRLSSNLEEPLKLWLTRCSQDLEEHIQRTRQMLHLDQAIINQATSMVSIRREFDEHQMRIEAVRLQLDTQIDEVLNGKVDESGYDQMQNDTTTEIDALSSIVTHFIDTLSSRVSFVSAPSKSSPSNPRFMKKRFSSTDTRLGFRSTAQHDIEIPFDLQALTDVVRSDINNFAMRLNGGISLLTQKREHLPIAQLAKRIDKALAAMNNTLNSSAASTTTLKASASDIEHQENTLEYMEGLLQKVEALLESDRLQMSRSLSPIRGLLQQMAASPCVTDPIIHEPLYLTRVRALSDAEHKYSSWDEDTHTLRTRISEIVRSERDRMEKEERERIAADEDERWRLEILRIQEEEQATAAEMERVRFEQLKVQEEEARLAAEAVEQLKIQEEERLERERVFAEEAKRQRAELLRIQEEARLEQERADAEEARLGLLRAQEQRCLEEERLAAEDTERNRLEASRKKEEETIEQERIQRLKEQAELEKMHRKMHDNVHEEDERLEQESARTKEVAEEADQKWHEEHLERERFEAQKIRDTEKHETDDNILHLRQNNVDDDVFGPAIGLAPAFVLRSSEVNETHSQVIKLRKQLSSLSIQEIAQESSELRSLAETDRLTEEFQIIRKDISRLAAKSNDPYVNHELADLNNEVEKSKTWLGQIGYAAKFLQIARQCDGALSDLLEHIDSYPSLPLGPLSSTHVSSFESSPEEQMLDRIAFTSTYITQLASFTSSDRINRERGRIRQTWQELEEMAKDRLSGRKSRANSVTNSDHSTASSSRDSAASFATPTMRGHKMRHYGSISHGTPTMHGHKTPQYSSISHGTPTFRTPSSRSSLDVPSPILSARRVVSGSSIERSAMSSRLSNRSTSASHGIQGSTFASRQRTTSLTPRKTGTPLRLPVPGARSSSPGVSDNSSISRSHTRSSSSMSSWSRAPRLSFPVVPRAETPKKKLTPPRKTYIANPKSKLDVAVGDVVNNLPVGINIEGVDGSWRDQSGKYWIGDQDAKLCFCRILRSQTVMVRVGGGWTELSRFIRDHFADSFRVINDSPVQSKQQEKWISAATLLETPELTLKLTPPRPPKTPEPHLPSFSISSPKSPHSSSSSPLTPLQFIRKAESDSPFMRPETPSRSHGSNTSRTRKLSTTPARATWRP